MSKPPPLESNRKRKKQEESWLQENSRNKKSYFGRLLDNQYNPIDPHCGPFNGVTQPLTERDQVCYEHDRKYEELIKKYGKAKTYLCYSKADGELIDNMPGGLLGSLYKLPFKLKRKFSKHLKETKKRKMGYRWRRKGRRTRRRRSMSRKKYVYKRKRRNYRKRRRFRRKRRVSVGFRALMSAAAPRNYTEMETMLDMSAMACYDLCNPSMVCDHAFYNAASTATAESMITILDANHEMMQYRTFASTTVTVQNGTTQASYVQPIYYWCKKDLTDTDYAASDAWQKGRQAMMDFIYNENISRTKNTDGYTLDISGANNRRAEAVEVLDGLPWNTPNLKRYFKFRKGRKIVLQPGAEATYKNSSKRIKRIFPKVHIYGSSTRKAMCIGGHTFGIMFLHKSFLASTAEADIGAEENNKVSVGYSHLAFQVVNRATFKRFPNQPHDVAYVDRRPTISEANARGIGNANMEEDDPVDAYNNP